MSRSPIQNPAAGTRSAAIAQCEMILLHLRNSETARLDPDFLRVHTVNLLQLVGEIGRPAGVPISRQSTDDLAFLFTGRI